MIADDGKGVGMYTSMNVLQYKHNHYIQEIIQKRRTFTRFEGIEGTYLSLQLKDKLFS